MKSESNEFEIKIVERDERAKKLYRYVSDVARRVDEASTGCRSIADLFSTRIEVQRQKLRDNCEKLLFLDSLNYGKKSLELLWRKVYYETISLAKKLESDNECFGSYLFTHIVCGVGHFHHLVSRIQSEMNFQFKELDYFPLHDDDESVEVKEVPTCLTVLGRSFLHSCLIYLGDLSRYQVEMFHTFEHSIAARYYLQAAHIDMSLGMPYNQLGNLYLDRNYNLDSVCYYIHCLSCNTPFEGAMGNLVKIFEKNDQYLGAINDPDTVTQSEHIQNTIAHFLSLIEIWYLGKNDTNIPQRCNVITEELKLAMGFSKTPLPDINKNYHEYVQATEEENINPSYMNSNLIHKIVLICLFTISKMNETDETKAFACKAFTLALLSQLLQRLQNQLESLGLKSLARKLRSRNCLLDTNCEKTKKDVELPSDSITSQETVEYNGVKETNETQSKENVTDEEGDLQNGNTKSNNKKVISKRRRRRRVASSESSDMSDADTESSEVDTDESGSDDMSGSSCATEDDSKSEGSCYENSEKGDDTNTKVKAEKKINGLVHDDDDEEEKIECNEDDEKMKVDEIQKFLFGDNFLPSIKLLQDWILTEKDLILSCGDSGEPLFQCVVDLLNIFTYYFSPKQVESLKNIKVLDFAKSIAKKLKLEYKSIPLPEDVNLRGINICKFDKAAAEWQVLDTYKPSVYEENVIRILSFIDFGNQIAKTVSRIKYNRSMKMFYVKRVGPPKLNTKISHKRSREWHNSKKPVSEAGEGSGGVGLLARLGRLWLASRVRELERCAAAPTLLVLTATALHDHLRRVKQLLRARTFVLLLPTVVLQELDDLKREKSSARDAIRWLEVQLKSGSRYLRAQRSGQSRPLPLLKYPRKAPPHVHNFINILEFCNHVIISDEKQGAGGNGDPDSSLHGKSTPLLILLVGDKPGSTEEQYKEFSVSGAAQAAGISVEYIADFYSKWRQTIHKSGKKR